MLRNDQMLQLFSKYVVSTHLCYFRLTIDFQHSFFKLSEPLRTLAPLIKAAREIAKSK